MNPNSPVILLGDSAQTSADGLLLPDGLLVGRQTFLDVVGVVLGVGTHA